MSIKPVDFQVMLPKTSEVSKINSDEQHKNQSIQQQQSQMLQQKSEVNTKQVYAQDKAYEAAIREKQEKDRRDEQKGSKKNNSKKNKDRTDAEFKTGTIDIRI